MYAPKDYPQPVVPVRLDLSSKFCFSCDKELACFTKCCRTNNISLTPYDIIRLKKRLGLSSDEFIRIYTLPGKVEQSDLPIPVMKPLDEENMICPFLSDEEGCSIYGDRPLACRYYPIAAGLFHNSDLADNENFFALVKEPVCLGHDTGQEMTIAEWRECQGIPEYDVHNAGWIEIILKRKSLGPFVNIPPKTLEMFFMASYNIDAFRRFVFNSKFLEIYVVPDELVERVKEDDLAALELSMNWLKKTLFGLGDLEIREQVAPFEQIEVD